MSKRNVDAMDTPVVRRRSTRIANIRSSATKFEATDTSQSFSLDTPNDDNSDTHSTPPVESPRKAKGRTNAKRKQRRHTTNDNGEEENQYNPTTAEGSPKKRKRAPKPEPVYVIPDVERRTTTFKGRLGYACLNTVLRNKKPAAEAVFCSRTCRLDTIKQKGIEFAKELGVKNVEDLLTIIQWNEDNNIRFMRISSELFPYASHAVHGYPLSFCAPLLARVGELASKYNHRLTTHPGQYTQLGSPKHEVVEAAVRELKYHCEMLDLMGIGKDGVMIVHGGGVYGDKPATLERITKTITEILPQNVRDRLVLENDELCYNVADLLPLCESLQVPLVFDYHHDALNPSDIPRTEIIARANEIFRKRGIRPKQHLSEPRKGAETLIEKRKHSARCETLPDELEDDMDLMIEAKDKEQAVFQLYRIYDLHPVVFENLRPATDDSKQVEEGREGRKRMPRGKVAKDERSGEEDDAEENDDGDEFASPGMDGEAEVKAAGDVGSDEGSLKPDAAEVLVADQPEEVTTQVMDEARAVGMEICVEKAGRGTWEGERRSPRKKGKMVN